MAAGRRVPSRRAPDGSPSGDGARYGDRDADGERSVDMHEDPRSLASKYFRAWKDNDFVTLWSILADDATFDGPLGRAADADECIRGLQGMSPIVTDVVIQEMFVDGPDVLTWFDLHTTKADPAPVANWSHVENGKMARIQVTFDARPLAPPRDR
jgi:hypothetical protein